MVSGKYGKAATKAAEVLVRVALGQIPVVGPFLSGGLELLTAAGEQLSNDHPVTKEEVLDLIRALPRSEYEHIVDQQLTVASNAAAVRNLSQAQLLDVRRLLADLPQSLANMLATAQQADRDAHNDYIARLHADLQVGMNEQRWFRANRITRRLIHAGRRDRELLNLERYTYGRHISPGRVVFYWILLNSWMVLYGIPEELHDNVARATLGRIRRGPPGSRLAGDEPPVDTGRAFQLQACHVGVAGNLDRGVRTSGDGELATTSYRFSAVRPAGCVPAPDGAGLSGGESCRCRGCRIGRDRRPSRGECLSVTVGL